MSNPVANAMKIYQPKNVGGNGVGKVQPEGKKVNSTNSVYSTWEDPVIPNQTAVPDISSKSLPGWLGEYVDALSKNTQTPTGMAVMMALSVVATCTQKRFEVSPFGDDYREPLSLWTITAMPPASRKTAIVSALTQPLADWEIEQEELLKEQIADVETKRAVNLKAIDRIQNDAAKEDDAMERAMLIEKVNRLKADTPDEIIAPRLWTADCTPERLQGLMAEHGERMGMLSDEGGQFEIMSGLYSDGRVNLDVFLKGHAGSPVRVDRGKRTVCLQKPALSFGLAVQPEVLRDFGNGSKRRFRGIGTLARFLYCIPASNIGQRDINQRPPIPETLKQAYKDRIFDLLNIKPLLNGEGVETPRIIRLSPEALSSWQIFAQFIESKQGEGGEYEHIQDWTGKLPGAALRIAGLCNVAKHGKNSLEIDKETMEEALDLCQLLIPHAQSSFEMMGAEQSVDDAKAVLKWIISKSDLFFKRSACHKAHHGRFKKVDRLITALDVLRGWNVVSDADSVKPENGGKGGRAIILYHVNPKILKETKSGKETTYGMA